ncbi:MAG: molybdopterin-dependent oxidoreductase [Candidatus Nezhaarchaeales archaeon]|nr:MAG: pyrogallol hydroxytransferase large subunit [Candidatus Nezhaarchaeota archaeon WYZ-LMO7]
MDLKGQDFPLEKNERLCTNCTVGGPVHVHVVDGKITRVRPLQLRPEDVEPWVIEARGRRFSPPLKVTVAPYVLAERCRIYSPKRVLKPLKRVDFDPKGERNPQNRGLSGYEEISWDEALEIVANEIVRIKEKYGSSAIAALTSSHHMWGNIGYRTSAFQRFFNLLGCTYVDHNPDSWEGWYWGAIHTWGFYWRLGQPEQYDLLEDALKHAEMIVFWSADPTATQGNYAGQESERWRIWLKELGVKMVFIDPFFNHTAVKYADKWLSPYPGTDVALALAIAYTWIVEGTYDKEFVERNCHGFEKWKNYVLGEEDGVPKTPAWAEEICGVSKDDITWLAKEWASKRTMLAPGGRPGFGGACRSAYGHEWSRMMVLLQAMQGLGKPGVNVWSTTTGAPWNYEFYFPGYGEGGISGDGAGLWRLVPRGFIKRVTRNTVRQVVNRLLLPEAILNPPISWRRCSPWGESMEIQFDLCIYPMQGYSKIKMLYRYGGSYIGTMTESNRYIRMYRSSNLEFVVCQVPWMEPEAKFADIILPSCTNFERWDIGEWAGISGYSPDLAACNFRIIVLQMKCIEPLGESKSDYEVFTLLADRLGFKEEYTEGNSELDWVRRMFEVSDLPKYISWEEFLKKGYFVVPIPKPYKSRPAFRWFYEGRRKDTPDRGPTPKDRPIYGYGLSTPTGKIEFVSENLKRFDPNDPERPIIPKFIEPWEWYRSEESSKYPLQLVSPHPRYSFHTQYDGKETWIDEIPLHRRRGPDGRYYWILRMNPRDAEPRGIKDGDLVKVYNDRGAVVCIAEVTERIRPGVVHAYESSGIYESLGEPGNVKSVDLGGCVNLLTPSRLMSKNTTGMAPNSCLVEVVKWRGQ